MATRFINYDDPRLADLTEVDPDITNALIEGASDAVEQYLMRKLLLGDHDEITEADQDGKIFLLGYPVRYVRRVYSYRDWAVSLQNTNTATSNATVSVGTDGVLRLDTITSGVSSTVSVALTSYPTLSSLVAFINSQSGWTASVQGDYGVNASSDLLAGQNIACKMQNNLVLWVENGTTFHVNTERGTLYCPYATRFRPVRVLYTGGETSVPPAIADVVAALVMNAWNKDGQIIQEQLEGYSYQLAQKTDAEKIILSNHAKLSMYRNWRAW